MDDPFLPDAEKLVAASRCREIRDTLTNPPRDTLVALAERIALVVNVYAGIDAMESGRIASRRRYKDSQEVRVSVSKPMR